MLAKRSMIEILFEILQMEGRKKTHIMYQAALTYPQVTRYLRALGERGLIVKAEDQRGKAVYRVTERGRELSRHLNVVMGYLGLGEQHE